MRNKPANKCEKVTNCLYWLFNSEYWCGPVIRVEFKISIKTDKELAEERKKQEEQLQEEKERLLPWGSA